MSQIDKKTIKHIAALSKFNLSDEEIDKFQIELSTVLDYIEQLSKIDTEGIEPTAQVTGLQNVSRLDEIQDYGVSRDDLLKNVPNTKNGYIEVNKVL